MTPLPMVEIAGIDGSGKSTLAAALVQRCAELGHPAMIRRWHSVMRRWSSALAARHGLKREEYIGQDAVELAVAVELVQDSRLIRRGGPLLILEPYAFNSAAIASALGIGNLPGVLELYLTATAPDLTVVLDLDVDLAMARITGRAAADNFVLTEAKDPFIATLHTAVRDMVPAFEDAGRRVLPLDGAAPIESNVDKVLEVLRENGSGLPPG